MNGKQAAIINCAIRIHDKGKGKKKKRSGGCCGGHENHPYHY